MSMVGGFWLNFVEKEKVVFLLDYKFSRKISSFSISQQIDAMEKRLNGCGSSSSSNSGVRHFDVINRNSMCDLPLKQWRHCCCWQLYSHFGDDVMSLHSIPFSGACVCPFMVWHGMVCCVLFDKQLSLTLSIAFLRIVRSMMWVSAHWYQHCGWTFLSFFFLVKSLRNCLVVWEECATQMYWSIITHTQFYFYSCSPKFSHTISSWVMLISLASIPLIK